MFVVRSSKPTAGLPSRKTMLETLIRRLDLVRLTVGAAALVMMASCTGLIDDTVVPTDLERDQAKARAAWDEKAWPVLQQECASCHSGSTPNVDFLSTGGKDLVVEPYAIRDHLVDWEPAVVNLVAPASSRLLTKGLHDGPELDAGKLADLLEWVRAEQDARPQPGEEGGDELITTEPKQVQICAQGTPLASCPVNSIDLPGIEGAKITFTALDFPGQLYINQLKLVGGAAGIYIEHPLFVSQPPPPAEGEQPSGEKIADGIDRYFNLKMNLQASTEDMIDGGTASFIDFPHENDLVIVFRAVSAYKAEEGPGNGGSGTTGGCKSLAEFKANAQQPLATNCGGCHLGNANANAKSAVDMTGMNTTDDAMIQLACNQIKTRVNLVTPDQSGIFIAPDPANNNHPFKFGGNVANYTAYKNAVLNWINIEKVQP